MRQTFRHFFSYFLIEIFALLQSIMDCYGIRTEGELFSGHYTSLRNRISDKDSDDMSFYNTSNAIEQRLFAVFGKFRKQFFETSLEGPPPRFDEVTTPAPNQARGGMREIFRNVCVDPSDEYKKLACAYYRISYGNIISYNNSYAEF